MHPHPTTSRHQAPSPCNLKPYNLHPGGIRHPHPYNPKPYNLPPGIMHPVTLNHLRPAPPLHTQHLHVLSCVVLTDLDHISTLPLYMLAQASPPPPCSCTMYPKTLPLYLCGVRCHMCGVRYHVWGVR